MYETIVLYYICSLIFLNNQLFMYVIRINSEEQS